MRCHPAFGPILEKYHFVISLQLFHRIFIIDYVFIFIYNFTKYRKLINKGKVEFRK